MTTDVFNDLPQLRLEIDPHNLAEEWFGQAQLMFEWGRYLADAQHATDIAKTALELAKAEVDLEIRASPAEFGLAKATDSAVQNAVLEQPTVKRKVKEYLAAKHRQAVLAAAVAAIEDRRRALQNVVVLHGKEYYGEPSVLQSPAGVRTRGVKEQQDE